MQRSTRFEPSPDRDASLFPAFYERYYPYVHKIAYSMWKYNDLSEDVDDVVQDVFVQAWRYFEKVQSGEYCHAWLKVITRHCIIQRRIRYYHRLQTVSMEDEHNPYFGSARPDSIDRSTLREVLPGPPVDFDSGMAAREIDDVLLKLDECDRKLILQRVDGVPMPVIAAQEHVTPEAIRQRLQRAVYRVWAQLPAA